MTVVRAMLACLALLLASNEQADGAEAKLLYVAPGAYQLSA